MTDTHVPPGKGSITYRACQSLAALIVRVMFDQKTYGAHHVPREGGVLVVSNHASYLDPVIVAGMLPRPFAFLADSYLWGFKPFGWLITRLNAFPVRQGKGDVGAIKQVIGLLNDGWALTIFPEGMRSPTRKMVEVQAGAALVIRKTNVPVVPAYIWGAFDAWSKHELLPRRKPVRVMYRPPMDMTGLSAKQITAKLTEVFGEMEAEAYAKFGEPGRWR